MAKKKSKTQETAEQAFLQIMLLLTHRLPTSRNKTVVKRTIDILDRAYIQAHFDSTLQLPFDETIDVDQADVLIAIRNLLAGEIGEYTMSHQSYKADWRDLTPS